MLISTKPKSKAVEAALFRSRQLTDFTWTPVGDIPVYTKETGKTKLPAGVEQSGMVYSSTEPTDKFITENITFESLMSIIANPDSAFYHKDLNGHSNSWAYFGVVCNGLVRYALGIERRYSTKRWPEIPGMRKIADDGTHYAQQMELCDVLYAYGKGRNHVSLVTDILRDASGNICQIEVSEAVRPTCVRKVYDLDAFYEHFRLFELWRYDFLDQVTMPDPHQAACLEQGVPPLPVIAVDYGNKSNYRCNEDVVISVFPEGGNEIAIFRGNDLLEKLTMQGRGKVTRKFQRGYYTIRHLSSGESVDFCVTDPLIRHEADQNTITIQADPQDPESQILYLEFRVKSKPKTTNTAGKDDENNQVLFYSSDCTALSKVEELTEQEKKTGCFTRKIPEDAGNFKIYFKNKYGTWTHRMIGFR